MSSMDDAPTMALLVRQDLEMSLGKTAAQCAHGAVEVVRLARRTRLLERWRSGGSRKIVLGIEDATALQDIASQVPKGCVAHTVADAGRTEVPAGSRTVLAILGPRRSMDALVSHLSTL